MIYHTWNQLFSKANDLCQVLMVPIKILGRQKGMDNRDNDYNILSDLLDTIEMPTIFQVNTTSSYSHTTTELNHMSEFTNEFSRSRM